MIQGLMMNNHILYAAADGAGGAVTDTPTGTNEAASASAPASAESVLYKDAASLSSDKPAEPDQAGDATKTVPDAEKKEPSPEDAAKAEAALKQVPDDGKYEFQLPEGMELDQALADYAAPKLKEAGITREQANQLAAIIAETRLNEGKAREDGWAKIQEEWVASAKADKEFGGEKFDASLKSASRALEKFGTPELQDYLVSSGGGNHPELIRLMARVGNAFSDDKPVGSETPAASQPRSNVDILYGPKG